MTRVLGVLAGNDMPLSQVEKWARSADLVFAADGGVNALVATGIAPELVIGDFDSALDGHGFATHLDSDQNTSDVDKLLAVLRTRGLGSVTLCNVEGDYPDHFLATLHSAARSSLNVRLALRRGLGIVLTGPLEQSHSVPIGTRVSLLPLEPCDGVTLSGVEWAIHDVRIGVTEGASLSNRATDSVIKVAMASGSALLVLLHSSLEQPTWAPPC